MLEVVTDIQHITLARKRVRVRAEEMIDMAWVLQPGHKQIRSFTDSEGIVRSVILPSYVEDRKAGDVMYGIPYCHGGFNGYDTISSSWKKTKFSNIITEISSDGTLYTAGNIEHHGLCPLTVGLDCSGFIGSAYGIDSKQSVSMLGNYGHRVSNATDLRLMDSLLYIPGNGTGNHCYLFVQNSDNDRVLIMDCTGRVKDNDNDNQTYLENCTASRLISLSKVKECVYYNPFYEFSMTATEHTYSCEECDFNETKEHTFEYVEYSANYHTKRCKECGYSSLFKHTWTPAGGGFACFYCFFFTETLVSAEELALEDEPEFVFVDCKHKNETIDNSNT